MRLTVRCYAKVNLGLAVYAPRADGYHEIATILQTISLADLLTCTPAGDTWSMTIEPANILPAGETNLVLRAARALEGRLGAGATARPRAHFHLCKRVPHGAGLGGGSSDAAATLRLLARLWRLPRSAATRALLHEVAASLGSDVPFFLAGGTALATGRGEILRSLPAVRGVHFVVVAPPFGISTPEAYSGVDWDLTPPKLIHTFAHTLEEYEGQLLDALRSVPRGLYNSFESTLFAKYPLLSAITRQLEDAGAQATALSGSGSAVFAVAASAAAARHLENTCTAAGLRAFRTVPVTCGSRLMVEEWSN